MNKKIKRLFSISITSILLSSNAFASEESNKKTHYNEKDFTNTVKIQGINKITARVSSFDIIQNNKTNFGNLEIQLVKCWKSPPEQEPENKALVKIWEQIPGEDKKEIFFGWMFSSSPALSALEHPVYDVVIKECSITKIKESEQSKNNI